MASKRESSKPELPAGKRNGVPPLLKARWLATETVERISADQLSVDEFRCRFASGSGTPLIVTDCASKWPALAGWRAERLAERYPETLWRVSASCDMTLPAFLDYCAALRPGSDPRPLYMFDRNWREKCPQLRDELTVPAYFAEDLMGVLGEARRPSYSWLTVGPPLSGSSFHVDPNANSAWNATVQGSKKWLLYPNSLPPAMDGDGLTQLSLVEWFADHYDDCPHAAHRLECITRPGEIMFIPAGWWHLVVNLELSVAVTHNVVTRDNLLAAADFMAVDQTCARGEGCRGATAFDSNGDVPASVINPRADAVAAVAPPSDDAPAPGDDEARSAPARAARADADGDEPPTCACNATRKLLWLDFQKALDKRSPGLLADLRSEAEARKRPTSLWEGQGLAPGQVDTSFAFNFGRTLVGGGLLACGAAAAAFALTPAASVNCDDGSAEARFQQQQLLLWLAHARARAESLLSEPPAGLVRFGAAWRSLAGAELAAAFDARCSELRSALAAVRASGGGAALEQLDALAEAINRAEEAMRRARDGARSRQTASSWSELIREAPLFRLGGDGAAVSADELAGKTVLLYFTAGWCAPCRDFTPRLMASARALDAASGGRVEVIQVSWDHDAIGFQKYADAVGMRWLALPHAERETARALSQRFEVATIPALLVLAVSADGKSAQLVSADGRVDVERYFAAAAGGVGSAAQQAPWVRQLLNPGAR